MVLKNSDIFAGSKGFTLIEVIVVIVIIGILSTIAFPMFSRWIPNYRLKGAAQELYSDLQKSKLHAIKTNRRVIFNFNVVADCSAPTGYIFTDSDGKVVASNNFTDNICLNFSDFLPSNGFDPRGFQAVTPPAVAAQHTVKITHSKSSRVHIITQSQAGSVSID